MDRLRISLKLYLLDLLREDDMLELKYFVLKPRSTTTDDRYAHASREALLAYAHAIECVEPDFAQELKDWRSAEMIRNTHLGEGY